MQDMIKMVVVVTLLCSVSGGLLAAVQNNTKDRIENQQLTFVKGPAIKSILEEASNDPIADRFKLPLGDMDKSFFVGVFDGEPTTVVLEAFGKGYGGDVGVMVGIDTKNNKLLGAGVTTHAETPGMGAKAKTDPSFVAQFKGMPLLEAYDVGSGDGQVNAISGATITSRAVCAAATEAVNVYNELKPQITEQMKAFAK
jgi:electron transport complex protein RnfG